MGNLLGSLEFNRVYQMDCIEGMKLLPDKSVDLIVADPPYYKIKGEFDFVWKTMDEYIEWCLKWLKECQRILSPKGSMYLYGMDLQLEHLASLIDKETEFKYKNRITLNKPSYVKDLYGSQSHFRKFIPVAEYILFYTLQDDDFKQKIGTGLSNLNVKERYLSIVKCISGDVEKSGLTKDQLIDLFESEGRYSSVESAKFHAVCKLGLSGGKRFDLMDEKMFNYLSQFIQWSFTYDELKNEYTRIRESFREEREQIDKQKWDEYVSSRYVFNASNGLTNVWEFDPPRGKEKTKHPTQKPLSLSEQLISISSNVGDTVLIPFGGSGSECVASVKLKRNFVAFETDPNYIEMANIRIDAAEDLIE